MHVTFFAADKDREYEVARPLRHGIVQHGDTCEIVRAADFRGPAKKTDCAVMIGVKGWSKLLMEQHRHVNKHVVYIDKGYMRRNGYYRMSVNAFQPIDYFQERMRPSDRFEKLNLKTQPMQKKGSGEHIVLAGGSVKYAMWHEMPSMDHIDPMTTWARKQIRLLNKLQHRPIVYRPKPSWRDAVEIEGVEYSRLPRTIEHELENAYCLITFGSNAGVDAVRLGVPVIILGDGAAQPMGVTDLKKVNRLVYPRDIDRDQWLYDLAYCQFTTDEMNTGLAWKILKERMA